MKRSIYSLCIVLAAFFSSACTRQESVIHFINPMIGASTSTTAGKSLHGLGKTFPGPCTPFGMIQLSPDTKTGGDNAPGYSWHHESIEGFSFIHMSGTGWYGEFGNFLVTPTTGALKTSPGYDENPDEGYRSRYSHEREEAKAGYYSVMMDDYGVKVELTAMPRAGLMRMTFPESEQSRIQIDLARRIGGTSDYQYIHQVNETTLEGWMKCTPECGGWGDGDGKVGYTLYFYCELSKPMRKTGVWSAAIPDTVVRRMRNIFAEPYQQWVREATISENPTEGEGKHIGFFTEFATNEGDEVLLKSGFSFVSIEGAKANLQHDIPAWNFEAVVRQNQSLWEEALSNVRVEGATDREKIIYYTALYHSLIDPRTTSDVDGSYVGGDGKVDKTGGYIYRTLFSGWDVFRSQFPLQTIINPNMVNDEVNSLISLAEKSGREYFPRWELMNAYSGCMIGNPAVSVLTDAYMKGIRGYDVEKGYRFSTNSVEQFGNGTLGYTPRSISHTLEYAYFDWCVGQLAKELGKEEDATTYMRRSKNYVNTWNDSIGWFAGRNENGSWGEWKGVLNHDLYCVESNPLQQGWFVPHDVHGLIGLIGKTAFDSTLTDFFDKVPDDFLWNDYYNHANEPVHHVPFLFVYAGKPYLTQKWTRAICDRAYGPDVMGLVGNEDEGQMSAWYVLAAMGMHPVCPGDNRYILTSPVFSKVEIKLDKRYYTGGTFTVVAHDNSPQNIYIQRVMLNGKELNRAWILHEEIVSGGKLEFFMGNNPNKEWGVGVLP